MTQRWQYLVVNWSQKIVDDPDSGQMKTGTYFVFRPGVTKSERILDKSKDDAVGFEKATNRIELLNELGEEGWELVSHTVTRTAIDSSHGYATTGAPIAERWTFKRPRPSAGSETS